MKGLVILLFLVTTAANSQTKENVDWKSDLEYLKIELPKKHYNFFTVRTKTEFEAGINEILIQSAKLSDFEMCMKLQKLIASFGDSHTRVNFGKYIDRNKMYPLQLYWFKDGIYILSTTNKNKAILGKRITRINGYSIEQIKDSISRIITVDNNASVVSTVEGSLFLGQFLDYFHFAKENYLELSLETQKGVQSNYKIYCEPISRNNKVNCVIDSLPYSWRNTKLLFTENYMVEDSIYYIQYNKCWSRELEMRKKENVDASKLPSFTDFQSKILETIEQRPIKKLVFDMRFNTGGNSLQGTKLITKLSGIQKINNKGRLYLVVGRRTFSSAILNAMDFKRETDAIIVGEETSGKPNHFGDIKNLILPSSGLKINYSTKYFKRIKKDVGTIIPDVKIEISFEDFSKGVDPVYEWIKSQY